MTEGWVLGVVGGSNIPGFLGQTPVTIGWVDGPPSIWGGDDQVRAELLARASMFNWGRVPRFRALRCRGCQRVEFDYREPFYNPKTAARASAARAASP